MAWNEPGNGKDKDPWGSRDNQGQPPDLEEALRKLHRKLNSVLGGGPRGSATGGGSSELPMYGVSVIAIILLVLYVLSGIYIVKPAERAAVFQFNRYIGDVGPGPHWLPRFIRSKTIVNIDRLMDSKHKAAMLTKDENIVSVELAVQYKVLNVKDFLFNVRNPHYTLEEVTDSVMRQVIGHSTLDDALTEGRELIRQQIKAGISEMLQKYQTGLTVSDVAMQPARAPEAVKEAFDDVIKAQEEEQRLIQQARAYEKQKLPIAEGKARRILAEANAYEKRVTLDATGETERFLAMLEPYEKAPKVTRQRLYLDVLQSVMSNTTKILVPAKGSNNLLYLPLDKLMHSSKRLAASGDNTDLSVATQDSSLAESSSSATSYGRENNATRSVNRDRSRYDRVRDYDTN